ncbi:DUF4440 domain-containing protein [Dyella koreensis]|uniref:Nuclear transport factor 2 family protein n=1 Tax=Dyella koreensis TaxID=311235 RepID=A0ABW8K236_9GAMM
MRTALAALLLSILAAATPAVCDAAASPTLVPAAVNDTIGQRLFAEERASWDLAIKRDATAYKALHAPDFFTVTGTGVVDRVRSETSAMDANVRFDQCELSGFDVRFVAENAALVTYHVKAAGLDHGKAFQLDSYASSLWMKRDGKWMNVFYQATPAPNR